jgi:uncharacterized protein (DUF362 family)
MHARARVALWRGEDRYHNVHQTLRLIANQLRLDSVQRVLIKPNFVVTDSPLAATHVDAVRAVLDVLRRRYSGPITVAEGPATAPAAEGFRRYGYQPLVQEYGVQLADLNQDDGLPVTVYDRRLRPLRLHLARSVVDSDFRISVGPPKTHDVVIVTLSLKNMIMGSLLSHFAHDRRASNGSHIVGAASRLLSRTVPAWVRRLPLAEWLQFRLMSRWEPSDKMKMHQSYAVINLNLALLAPLVAPHLAIIDGFDAMEGNGPSAGMAVPWRLALASTDGLAADVVATNLMGFQASEVGYLHYCRQRKLGAGDLAAIDLVGNTTLHESRRAFRPHETYSRQRRWRLPEADRLLEAAAVPLPWPAPMHAEPGISAPHHPGR